LAITNSLSLNETTNKSTNNYFQRFINYLRSAMSSHSDLEFNHQCEQLLNLTSTYENEDYILFSHKQKIYIALCEHSTSKSIFKSYIQAILIIHGKFDYIDIKIFNKFYENFSHDFTDKGWLIDGTLFNAHEWRGIWKID